MRRINLARFFTALAFVFTLTYLSQGVAYGQCATNGSPNIQSAGWQKGTTVNYFIDPSITDANARDAITQAFENWNNASDSNNSGVTYVLTTTRPTSGVGNYLIVNYGSNLTDRVRAGFPRGLTRRRVAGRVRVVIRLDALPSYVRDAS